ncbi:MAG: glycosyltransferase family 4 protein [Thermoanaerobaculia bacterium]|nr:glycosyltransferase family 4 protein [Thermoanaerobaculia bacterium]
MAALAVPVHPLGAALSLPRLALGKDPLQAALFSGNWARQIERAGQVDLCLVVLTRLLPFLRNALPSCPLVVDFVDALGAAAELSARQDPAIWRRLYWRFEAPRLARAETELGELASATLATTPRDVSALPSGTVAIPNGVVLRPLSTSSTRRPLVAFTGRLAYRPNEIACRLLVDEVWPMIRASRRDAELLLAGADAPGWLRRQSGRNGIRVESPAEDIATLLRSALIAVAPLPPGMGTPNKVFEAFEAGCAVVGTPDLSERCRTDGVDAPIRVTSTPKEIAGVVLELLSDPEKAALAGREGRAFVERFASRTGVLERLGQLYSSVLKRR